MTLIGQVLFILGTPLALCIVITRVRRDGLAGCVRRMAVTLYAVADALECAQHEYQNRKVEYTANARLSEVSR